ncbi:MAG TPA: hypothetical protein VMT37_09985 [Solirubrobacterales bacterium]|nr:hypothetical protein [Solirubrobacterales bacterium]
MKRLSNRLTYANVISTLALFLVLAGGSALAANQLAKNSVGSKQLKSNAVTAAKIKNAAVGASKIADGAITSGKIANGSVTGEKIADNAVTTNKLADNAVTTSKIADGAVTGAKVNEGSLHFTCNNPANAVLLLGGPCVYKTTRAGGATWTEAIQACQTGVPGATLPTVAQVEAYARLGGVPWKEVLAFTSDLAGGGPNPSGAWSVQTDENGNVNVIVATPLTNKVQTDVLCVYDPASDPTPGS